MLRRILIPFSAMLFLPLLASLNASAQTSGRIAGTVVDAVGTPQMGATVSIVPEQVDGSRGSNIFTDARGRFLSVPLATGLYTVNVTLAGFLPTLEQHVDVDQLRTTMLRVQLGTAFASLERSGSRPAAQRSDDKDDWTWVVRGATATRPILRWTDGEVVVDQEESSSERSSHQPRAELAISAGSYQPGLVTNFSDAPTTSFAYDMNLGAEGHLLMAGAFSYLNEVPAGGFDTLWVQKSLDGGQTVTGIVFRQSELGPNGPGFHGMRLTRQSQIAFTDNLKLHYGADFVMAYFNGFTSAVRPDVQLTMQAAPHWQASFIVASRPWEDAATAGDSELQSAITSLNAFPALLERNNRPVLQGGWHEEAAIEHQLGKSVHLTAAAFHDDTAATAVFGEGTLSGANVLPDYFSNGFAYDAGASSSWGARFVYREKIGSDAEASLLYTWAGVLAPNGVSTTGELSNLLTTRYRQSVGARISAKVPVTKTKVTAGYVWISGNAATRPDPYGESVYGFDPFLSLAFHQPLPSFFPGHMMLVADVSNLLAQGYVAVTTKDGQVLLIPAYRAFQGGVSFQF